jgi:hypothetical protein
MSIPANTAPYDWILAITTIAFVFASAGNGANDVANSYATSVAARTLTMPQAGVLAVITEFIGAVALGARVTSTIKVRDRGSTSLRHALPDASLEWHHHYRSFRRTPHCTHARNGLR